MGTVNSLRNVKNIVEAETQPVIVVVSALGGITDRLIATAQSACRGDKQWHEEFEYIVGRHKDIADGFLQGKELEEVWSQVSLVLEELRDVYRGIELVRDLSQRTLDRVVSFGERMSSFMISHIITDAALFYSPDFVRTEKWFSKNIPDNQLTDTLIKERFKSPFKVAVAPGFISSDRENGEITNLGRGGSDFTAALIAASLNADVLEIWTDVDGFMTADPRVIPAARVIPRLSFVESMDLCNFGAKVIYPPTIYPVFHKNIPIIIKNTLNPSAPGTFIADEHIACEKAFRGVSSIKAVNLFKVQCANPEQMASRIFSALTKNGVEVLLTSRELSDEHPVTFAVRESEAERAQEVLTKEFETELANGDISELSHRGDVATLSVVGENLRNMRGISDRIVNTLYREGIEVMAVATGASEITVSVVIATDSLTPALKLIHQTYLE